MFDICGNRLKIGDVVKYAQHSPKPTLYRVVWYKDNYCLRELDPIHNSYYPVYIDADGKTNLILVEAIDKD